jgi:hypothetical protein
VTFPQRDIPDATIKPGFLCVVGAKAIYATLVISVANTRLLKTEDYVCCGCSDIWRVQFSESAIITMLKSVTRKRQVKTEDFYVSCGYSVFWNVWFSGTVIVGCCGDS